MSINQNLNNNNNNNNSNSNKNIKVCIRMRPLLQHEDMEFWQIDESNNCIYTSNFYSDPSEIINESMALANNKSNTSLMNKDVKRALIDSIYSPQKFSFDKVYSNNSNSQIIYKEMCRDVTKSVINGFNCSIFMYGQTTSGKTFTMLGSPNSPGVLPCALRDVFNYINSPEKKNFIFNVYVSYLEIYNENIHDLLTDSNYLKLVEDSKYGVIVAGAKRVKINNFEDGIGIKDFGEENRKYRETLFNEYSSRSHTIFQIFIESTEIIKSNNENNENDNDNNIKDNDEEIDYNKSRFSCLNLIDLAGSERISEYETKNEGSGETGYINKSLFVLANVINKLAENKKNNHIPYRDSKLTRLLSQALGGNSLTTIICTVSPAAINYYQTLSTLRFAIRAKNVKLKPKENEYSDEKGKIEFYKNEIKKLKNELKKNNNNNSTTNIKNNNNNLLIKNDDVYNNNMYEHIVKTNENLNNELKNYKELYLNEKLKNNEYRNEIQRLKNQIVDSNISTLNKESFSKNKNDIVTMRSNKYNNNTNTEDEYIGNVISMISDRNENSMTPQWKNATKKLSEDFKNDLLNLKSNYVNKVKTLQEVIGKDDLNLYNKNIYNNNNNNNIYDEKKIENINLEKNNKSLNNNINQNNDLSSTYNSNFEINNQTNSSPMIYLSNFNSNNNTINLTNSNNNNYNQIFNRINNDETIEKIKNGKIFDNINLDYNPDNSDNFENNVKNLKNLYEIRIDNLEKTMDYYKGYIEKFYRKKIQQTSNTNMDNVDLFDGNLPIMQITTEHNDSLTKLRELYDNKIKDLETNFFSTLRTLTAKRINDMSK